MIFDRILMIEPSLTALLWCSEDILIGKEVKFISDGIPISLLKLYSKIKKLLLNDIAKKICLILCPINFFRPFYQELSLIVEKIRRIALKNLRKQLEIALILSIIKTITISLMSIFLT
jgi:hypothetical protein